MEDDKQPLRPGERFDSARFSNTRLYLVQSPILDWLHDFYLAGLQQSTFPVAKASIGGDITLPIIS